MPKDNGELYKSNPSIKAERQEPVAYLHKWVEYHPFGDTVVCEPMQNVTPDSEPFDESDTVTPLYTAPRQREIEEAVKAERERCAKIAESCEWPTWAESGDEREVIAEAIRGDRDD